MKEKFCLIVFVLSAFFMFGVIGGIERGQSLKNIWACLVLLAIMYVSYKIGFKEN